GPSGSRYPTVFYRKTFVVADPSAYAVLLPRLLRDDGAVVYLNGVEIVRDNVPSDTPLLGFANVTAAGGADETTYFVEPAVSSSLLVAGTNILAVENHQVSATSSDLAFDFELLGNVAPVVAITSPADGAGFTVPVNVTITANATDSDGAISKVEFFQNGIKIGENSTGPNPFSFAFTNVQDGVYTLSAVATDNGGTMSTSGPVSITVTDTNRPALVSAVGQTNQVLVQFSKRVSAPSATTPGNYTLDHGASVSSAVFGVNSNVVILSVVSPLAIGTTYTLTVSGVQDSLGNTILPNSQTSFVILDFLSGDIGAPSIPGSSVPAGNGFNVTGSGSDIGGTSDQFQFNYIQRAGDFDVKVRVAGLNLSDAWAKAGLMARETLTAGSRYAATFATPSVSGCFFQYRGTNASPTLQSGSFPVSYPNTWLRVKRVGNLFTGYASFDGDNWSLLGSTTIAMANAVYVGMAVTSRNTGQSATGQFRDYMDVTGGTIGAVTLPVEPAGPSSRKTPFVITEIMYKPLPATDLNSNSLEFIEIYNSNPFFEEISKYRLSGDIDYTFPANTFLQGGQYIVVARSPAAVQTRYGLTGVFGPYTNSLKRSGTVRLRNNSDGVVLEIKYSNDPPWPVGADGTGHSLTLVRPSYGEADPQAWAASDEVGGSPGRQDPFPSAPQRNVVINEFLANSEAPDVDYIELYNHSNVPVDLSGCTLSDQPDTNKFAFTNGTFIQAHSYRSIDENQLGFGLSASGETIYFRSAGGVHMLEALKFEDQSAGVSSGRYPDGAKEFYPLSARTPGAANAAILSRDIVINELMYKPISGLSDDEYVELYNKGASAVNLGGWKFTAGIDYKFPSNVVLAADGYLVVAKKASRLLTNYPNLNANNTYGDYNGTLANGGERV
ncbi:MAG TPA: lamin tail domain-containing protein, partial [Verrucomicrobiae bacterium]